MPRGDGTGPWGAGPMTGRAAGYCAGFGVPGFANPVGFRAFGGGWGRGRGWRRMYYATGIPGWARFPGWVPPYPGWAVPYGGQYRTNEADVLKEEAKALEEELRAIKERLKELEGKKDNQNE